ncbi:ribose 5-phosphate isomerase B [Candidatus Pelagibacter sp.]|nr:ribose 5-phosphate isomerase B [Candidatus Pelagibacter sp.]
MSIFISSDHAGFSLKNHIIEDLKRRNHKIIDLGPLSDKSVDYPIFAKKLANKVSKNKTSFGILICGSGTGMAMAANKVKNIRAAMCYNVKNTKLSRLHNNANIITVGSRLISKNLALKLVNIFLKTKFESGRHLRRIKKI